MSTVGTSGASIEYIHNEVHTAVGGQHPLGHMADLAYSGFDPVFMVHHSAIDRHVALWQAMYYNVSGFESYVDGDGEFATPPGTNISIDYPLLPFHKDEAGTFWTSRSAWDVSGFGYSYPELAGDWPSREDRARNVTAEVNALYGGLHNRTNDSPCRRRWTKGGLTPYYEYFAEISVDKSEVQLPAEIVLSVNGTEAGRFSLMSMPARGLVHADLALEEPKNLETTNWSGMSSLTALLRMINVEVFDVSACPAPWLKHGKISPELSSRRKT
jgi:tyrosinase